MEKLNNYVWKNRYLSVKQEFELYPVDGKYTSVDNFKKVGFWGARLRFMRFNICQGGIILYYTGIVSFQDCLLTHEDGFHQTWILIV